MDDAAMKILFYPPSLSISSSCAMARFTAVRICSPRVLTAQIVRRLQSIIAYRINQYIPVLSVATKYLLWQGLSSTNPLPRSGCGFMPFFLWPLLAVVYLPSNLKENSESPIKPPGGCLNRSESSWMKKWMFLPDR